MRLTKYLLPLVLTMNLFASTCALFMPGISGARMLLWGIFLTVQIIAMRVFKMSLLSTLILWLARKSVLQLLLLVFSLTCAAFLCVVAVSAEEYYLMFPAAAIATFWLMLPNGD